MSHSNLQKFLDRLTSRSVLYDDEREAILDLPAQARQVESKSDLVSLGESTDHASLVVHGIIGRFDQNRDGERQITAFHLAGDMANLGSVVQPRASSALQALSPTTIIQVPHLALRRIAARYPAVAEAFWRDCTVDAAILAQWVINVGFRDARMRIAHLLCELATRYRGEDQSQSSGFAFVVNQVQLAEATGMSPVHVNRTLQTLRHAVTVSGKAVEIIDWAELARLGDFHPEYLHCSSEPGERIRLAALV